MPTPIDPDTLPREPEELAKHQFELARLSPDSPQGCPVSMRDVERYVGMESAGQSGEGLNFVRTADIEGVKYWLWEFDDDGEPSYVTVSSYEGSTLTGLESKMDLSPEQFLVYTHLLEQYEEE